MSKSLNTVLAVFCLVVVAACAPRPEPVPDPGPGVITPDQPVGKLG